MKHNNLICYPSKSDATTQLIRELSKWKQSGEEKGWLSLEQVKQHLKKRYSQI